MKSFVISLLLMFNSNTLNSTPTVGRETEILRSPIKLISEIIFDKHNVDIENRGLYYGYLTEYEDNCNVIIKLMDFSKKELLFNVDFCKRESYLKKNKKKMSSQST